MPIGDLLASITGEPSPTTTTFPPSKRKADDDLQRPTGKMQKTRTQIANSSRPITQSNSSSAVNSLISKSKVFQNDRTPIIQNSATSTFKNGQPTPPPTNDPTKAPKKGSFAEIMARGKAVQSTLGQVGKIQHKKIEKLPSKREREAMQARKGKIIQKALDPNSKFRGATQAQIRDGKDGIKGNRKIGNGKLSAVEPEKKIKKAATATTGYAGTARPKPDSFKSSSRTSATTSSSRRFHDRGSSRQDRYLSEDEEDEEMEEDEEYYSDESDMEAAAFEVDEEEELATRIARKEDAEALAEENRLKQEKLEKKRKLEALAKKAPGRRC